MPVRPPVTVRLQGGLGNQLYQYAAARSLSICERRPLLIETKLIAGESYRHYALSAFNISGTHVGLLDQWNTRWACSVRAGRTFRIICPMAWNYKICHDKENGYDNTIYGHNHKHLVMQGYWQSYRYFEKYTETIKRDYTFREDADDNNTELIAEISNKEAVAIHIRRGDYVSNSFFNETLGICSREYYDKALKVISKKVNNPYYYVFTDDPAWVKNNFYIPGLMSIVDHNLGRADHEDLRLMMHCKHFIIANSSFSWWGAWLAYYKDKVVIAPAQWFKNDRTPHEDRIPHDWMRI